MKKILLLFLIILIIALIFTAVVFNIKKAEYRQLSQPQREEKRNVIPVDVTLKEKEEEEIALNEDRNYFDDAIFIGNSRTQGLFLYSDITSVSLAKSYAKKGFTTDDIFNENIFDVKGNLVCAMDAVMKNTDFKKAYIMLGVNELSPSNKDHFIENYEKIIDNILKTNPKAIIVIQSIIPVTKKKSDNNQYVNNENITYFNDCLKNLAKEKETYFLDVFALLSDENGNLDPKYALPDGIHLTNEACQTWFEFLCENKPT